MRMGYLSDDRDFPGWRACSVRFLVASCLTLASIALDAYLIYRHWHTAPAYVVPILSIPIGLQLIYQWWRVLRYQAKIQDLYSKGVDIGVPKGSALDFTVRVATRAMIELLFFSNGMILLALILIGGLLTRLDGIK